MTNVGGQAVLEGVMMRVPSAPLAVPSQPVAPSDGFMPVYDLLPPGLPWIFPAGRLDADSEGLLAEAEMDDAVARLNVWRGLFAVAYAQGDLRPFLDLLGTPGPGPAPRP